MSAESRSLVVSIMGREFRVACPPEQEQALLEAVAYLDQKMREIRDAGKVIGVERIAVMAALNIAHELLTIKVADAFDTEEFKRRMNSMQAAIDEALKDQTR